MSARDSTAILPARRPAVVMRALAEMDQFVVKNGNGHYYDLDERSYFLLGQLDGQHTADALRTAYHTRFAETLTDDELSDFVTTVREYDLVQDDAPSSASTPAAHVSPVLSSEQSVLSFRVRLVDPNRLLKRLAPRLWFFWTPAFVALAMTCILSAAVVSWDRRAELVQNFADTLAWRSVLLAWIALGVVTVLHEFAHGLTCKHFGGDIRDMGFLMLFFMPCFYANVSDAWLFPKRAQRLWVTFAGGFFELWVWSLAVFAWAVLQPGPAPPRCLPCRRRLWRADPVQLQPAVETRRLLPAQRVVGHCQSARTVLPAPDGLAAADLLGAPRPEADPRGRILVAYGLVSLTYSILVMMIGLFVLARLGGRHLGFVGLILVGVLAATSLRTLFTDISRGEVRTMLQVRRGRVVVWLTILTAVPAILAVVAIPDRAGGSCHLRAVTRTEVRAPVAGILRELPRGEGERVAAGEVIAVLDIPDLPSRTAQKSAEVAEARAHLRLLEAGTRPEEKALQRQRVGRTSAARDLAKVHLAGAQAALQQELARLDGVVAQSRSELQFATDQVENVTRLKAQGAASPIEVGDTLRRSEVARAQVDQSLAQRRARESLGAQEAEAELARRDRDLSDEEAKLALMEAGPRAEEVEAERARVTRLVEQLNHLTWLREQTRIVCRSSGVVVTPRVADKLNQPVHEGELIVVVEETTTLEAEVELPEGETTRLAVGQVVRLKLRSHPHDTLEGTVVRIAPTTRSPDPNKSDEPRTLTAYCRFDSPDGGLRPGMTGYARIYSADRSVGGYVLDRAVRFVRTEFWW